MNRYDIAVVVVIAALASSLVLTANYFSTVRSTDETTFNNMMTIALGSYATQIVKVKNLFTGYLAIKNPSLYQEWVMLENETLSCAYNAKMAVDVCLQRSKEEIYNQLWMVAGSLEGFATYYVGFGLVNETKLANATSALNHISRFFWDFDIVDNKNPIDRITQNYGANATTMVIYYCQIVQSNLPQQFY